MRGDGMGQILRIKRFLPLCAALLVLALGAEAQTAATSAGATPAGAIPEPDQSFESGSDFVLYPPERGRSSFRFLPDGDTVAFDRSLVLTAAPGERRVYYLQSGSDEDIASGDAPIAAYVVNKTRPSAPRAAPDSGLYSSPLEPVLSAEEGATIYWTLVGPQGAIAPFSELKPDSRPKLSPPASGSVTYSLLAYAQGSTGSRSYPTTFVYRMTEPKLPAAAPAAETARLSRDPSLIKPSVESSKGFALVKAKLSPGATLLVSFAEDSEPASLDDFERIEADESGAASLRIGCPYAWSGDIKLYYGELREGISRYSPEPLIIRLSYPADEKPLPAIPASPVLAADPRGRASFLSFPAYDGDVYVSVGNAKALRYEAPVALPKDQEKVLVSWYGEDGDGRKSPSRSRSFDLPLSVPDIDLSGIVEGATIGADVVLKPAVATAAAGKAVLRYELTLDGSLPPEPSASSPLFGDSLAVSCPAGEERAVVLRYRSFASGVAGVAGAAAGEGRVLRFYLDKKPPEPPRFRDTPSAYSDKSASLELLPGTGGKDVYASVATEGGSAPFLPVASPLVLTGSESGPVNYVVRAYDVDAAGNKSPEMRSFSIVVDRSSVYAAEDGSDKGDGSPDRPYKSLDLALAAAARGGKRSVNIRGSLEMRRPVRFASEIGLVGGFNSSWGKDSSSRATVRINLAQGQTAFTQTGGSLSLRRVGIVAEAAPSVPLFALADASLFASDSGFAVASDGDFVLVSALRSKVAFSGSRIDAAKAMAFTAFSSDRSEITVASSSIIASQGVRVFGAFDMDGGSLALRESLVESGSDLGLNMLALRSSSLSVDRSLLKAQGGSGFLRIGSFKAVSGEIKNSKVIVEWKGPGTLFETQGAAPALRHDTISAGSTGALRFFDSRGTPPQVWNSILDCSSPGSELLRSDSVPAAGSLVADCVWGFEKLVSGSASIDSLQSLNALNALNALYSSRPIVSEPPEASFAAPLKSQAPLRRGSLCIDAALPIESGYGLDFGGRPRPAPGKSEPDIGADEFYD
jgi:hypothetical protein